MIYEGHKVYMNGEYPAIFLDGQNKHIHRLEWQKHHGPIPEGCIREHAEVVHRKGVPVIAIKGDTVLSFSSIEEAATGCGTYPCSIQRILKGLQRSSKGWTFRKVGG